MRTFFIHAFNLQFYLIFLDNFYRKWYYRININHNISFSQMEIFYENLIDFSLFLFYISPISSHEKIVIEYTIPFLDFYDSITVFFYIFYFFIFNFIFLFLINFYFFYYFFIIDSTKICSGFTVGCGSIGYFRE